MIMREHVPLEALTTLRVGGVARFVCECVTEEDVREAIAFATAEDLPWYVLGEGSNVLAPDAGYAGVIIRMLGADVRTEERDDRVLVTALAGIRWDALVTEAARLGLWGIENLAGIPGTVGASPVQNIGAYGMEVKDTIESVRILDTKDGALRTLAAAECDFGYRDSRFKRDASLVILSVTFALTRDGTPQVAYKDLANAASEGKDLSTPGAIGNAVRAIRARKFPDLSVQGTAGSFFKNPVIDRAHFATLKESYAQMPGYETIEGIKIPLAFVLDQVLGLRGHLHGNVSLFENQPLVLVTREGATADEVDAFADEIVRRVHEKTGIVIEREVRVLS